LIFCDKAYNTKDTIMATPVKRPTISNSLLRRFGTIAITPPAEQWLALVSRL
jgi:hypothetical protein